MTESMVVPELSDNEMAVLEACRVLGKIQGIAFRLPQGPALNRDHSRFLAELCPASGVRHRKVTLREGWWRRDSGPMLVLRTARTEGALGACALVFHGGCYRLTDAASTTSRRVDAALAAELEPEGFVFYRPLPDRPLTFSDLLQAGLSGRMRDVSSLAAVSIFAGLLALATPMITRQIVDSSIAASNRLELLHMVAALCVSAAAASIFDLARSLTVLRLKSGTAVSLQTALWDRLLAMPVSFFRGFAAGDLTNRAMGVDQLQHLLTADVAGAVFAVFSAMFSLAILFHYSWPLALLAFGSVLLLALFTALTGMYQLRHLRLVHRLNAGLGAFVYSLLSGIAKLRAGGAEGWAFERWAGRFSETRRHTLVVRRLSNIQSVFAAASGIGATIAVFAIIGLSSSLEIGAGDFLAFNAAFAQFQAAALAGIGAIPTLLAFVPVYERMQPILKTTPESHASQAQPGLIRGEIELRNVSFRYPDGPLVLDGISLVARPGEFIALAGPSGSGKSTCLRLMLGFERPENGAVLIDGNEIESLNMELVRREFGVVIQNGRPLAGDIFRNIVGSLPLTLDDAWRAARFVAMDDEIRSMPMSMFTVVNARGVSFSAGQRQRLLLARAIVRRPRILLLDEATSALDNRTQEFISGNLAGLGATRIMIAHRLSTIRNADRIYVFDRGRIVEQGTYSELVQNGKLFSRMAERQLLRNGENGDVSVNGRSQESGDRSQNGNRVILTPVS